ncbi:DNA mismatch repair protein MutL [Paenibacillus sp. BIHB 4019]|uniref:DNA mismatch repair protein MutL n=1 Tax=Paenibacillus sp. BIHB 4019 TaxID=1870819 RepID=A0A1B2DN23_9BACL|nr:DNA mismatch repair endonuclease MutL [Paenibacillus sp. BIHB 4019]ANY69110.1 DNA mismatch repair protein MutL [Paenibacillus sp. BIHB 4019]
MGKILVLDEQLANQIAAGEVVERPASVIKELVENAVDAGSSTIDITVEEGGLNLIRVTDNGSGIPAEEIETAFQRHATSKIATSSDLFRIASLGFRGEALPSIAAVSRLECLSSTGQTGLGHKLSIEGGTITASIPAAMPQGTDMTVRDLFYNTPARLKYMKAVQTELGHISDYIYRIALAHPGIAFTLKHNGNTLLRTLGTGDRLQVIAAIYGSNTAKAMMAIQGESPDYELLGYISKPELTRSNRNGITVIVNGRYIRSHAVNQAMLQAYHTLLPINRFPLAIIEIGMHPSLLDVNVHPSKMEVRFSKEAELRTLVETAIQAALGKERHIPGPDSIHNQKRSGPVFVQGAMSFHRPEPKTPPVPEKDNIGERSIAQAPYSPFGQGASREFVPKDAAERLYKPAQTGNSLAREASAAWGNFASEAVQSLGRAAANSSPSQSEDAPLPAEPAWIRQDAASSQTAANGSEPGNGLESAGAATADLSSEVAATVHTAALPDVNFGQGGQVPVAPEQPSAANEAGFPELHWIGQLHGTYIVAQSEEGLYLIDQHAAHERINYEYYYAKFGMPEAASQQLLVPLTLEFTPGEAEQLRGLLPLFNEAGVELEPFGSQTFLVRAYPQWLPDGEEKDIIEEMADLLLAERKSINIAKLREKAAIMCSCKASIKANDRLTREEGAALLSRLGACHQPYTCPHGRPIVVHMSTYQLEKMFKRVMS